MRYVKRCLNCDRPLTSKRSREKGAGEKCERKMDAKLREVCQDFHVWQVRKALDAIAANRFIRCGNAFRVLGETGGYLTTVDTCTCPAAEHDLKCYHMAGVRLLTP